MSQGLTFLGRVIKRWPGPLNPMKNRPASWSRDAWRRSCGSELQKDDMGTVELSLWSTWGNVSKDRRWVGERRKPKGSQSLEVEWAGDQLVFVVVIGDDEGGAWSNVIEELVWCCWTLRRPCTVWSQCGWFDGHARHRTSRGCVRCSDRLLRRLMINWWIAYLETGVWKSRFYAKVFCSFWWPMTCASWLELSELDSVNSHLPE